MLTMEMESDVGGSIARAVNDKIGIPVGAPMQAGDIPARSTLATACNIDDDPDGRSSSSP